MTEKNQWYIIENYAYCGTVNARAVQIDDGRVIIFDHNFDEGVIVDANEERCIPIPFDYTGCPTFHAIPCRTRDMDMPCMNIMVRTDGTVGVSHHGN